MGEEIEVRHYVSSPEGMARERAAYRANVFGIAVVSTVACFVFLNSFWWMLAGVIGLAAFWIASRRYPWRSGQQEAVLGPAEVSFSRGREWHKSSVESMRGIELFRSMDHCIQLVVFRDRLDDGYTLWRPEDSGALERWIAEVAVPAGVPVVERRQRFGLWNPRYLFLEACLINGVLLVVWGLVVTWV